MSKAVIFIPTLTAGGAERVASILANEWTDQGLTEVVVVNLFHHDRFYPVNAEVEVLNLGMEPHGNPIHRILMIFIALLRFRKLALDLKPRFVLSFMNKYNVFCIVSLLFTDFHIIAAERDSPTERLPLARSFLRRLTYPLASSILVQSFLAKDFIASIAPRVPVSILPNPVLTLVKTPDYSLSESVILNVSRLHPKKGQRDLILAFAQLDATDWKLIFCGDGEARNDLENLVSDLGVKDRVCFNGAVTDLAPHFIDASIFAFTSYWEGFPNALAEAVASGLPCVSYDCPTGPGELIDDGVNGFLVDVGDVNDLVAKLQLLIDNAAMREQMSIESVLRADKYRPRSVAFDYFAACEFEHH